MKNFKNFLHHLNTHLKAPFFHLALGILLIVSYFTASNTIDRAAIFLTTSFALTLMSATIEMCNEVEKKEEEDEVWG